MVTSLGSFDGNKQQVETSKICATEQNFLKIMEAINQGNL